MCVRHIMVQRLLSQHWFCLCVLVCCLGVEVLPLCLVCCWNSKRRGCVPSSRAALALHDSHVTVGLLQCSHLTLSVGAVTRVML
jgi:hypothetical protein